MIWIGKMGIYEIKSPLFPWNVVLYCMPWNLVNWYFWNCASEELKLQILKQCANANEKKKETFTKILRKKNVKENFSEIILVISRIFSEFVEKTVLIRKIVLFFGFEKPY